MDGLSEPQQPTDDAQSPPQPTTVLPPVATASPACTPNGTVKPRRMVGIPRAAPGDAEKAALASPIALDATGHRIPHRPPGGSGVKPTRKRAMQFEAESPKSKAPAAPKREFVPDPDTPAPVKPKPAAPVRQLTATEFAAKQRDSHDGAGGHETVRNKAKYFGNDKLDDVPDDLPIEAASGLLLGTISQRLTAALEKHVDPARRTWGRAFADYDKDKSGLIDFYEFRTMVRKSFALPPSKCSDYELNQLWVAADADAHGRKPSKGGEHDVMSQRAVRANKLTADEFMNFIRLCDRNAQSLAVADVAEIIVARMREVIPEGTRSWAGLFKIYDTDGSGLLSPKELSLLIRGDLAVTERDLSRESLKSLWAALDYDKSGHASVLEWRKFLERCGVDACDDDVLHGGGDTSIFGAGSLDPNAPVPRMNKQFERLREQSMMKRGHNTGLAQPVVPAGPGGRFRAPITERPGYGNDKLNVFDVSGVKKGEKADPRLLARVAHLLLRRMTSFPDPASRTWGKLFWRYDRDGSGLMDAFELTHMLRKDLGIGKTEITDHDLQVIWVFIENLGAGRSRDEGRISAAEFASFMRVCNKHAAVLSTRKLATVCNALNESGKFDLGGWGPLFLKFDDDGSGFLAVDEFRTMIRSGLGVSKDTLDDDELLSAWHAADSDNSGCISAAELAQFLGDCGCEVPAVVHRLDHNGNPIDEGEMPVRMNKAFQRRREAVKKKWTDRPEQSEARGPDHRFRAGEGDKGKSKKAPTIPRMNKQFERRLVSGRIEKQRVVDHGLNGSEPETGAGKRFGGNNKLARPELASGSAEWEPASIELLSRLYTHLDKHTRSIPDAAARSWFMMFASYDLDDSGLLDFYEFSQIVRGSLRLKESEVSPRELQQLWNEVDTDGAGEISAPEFAAFMRLCERTCKVHTCGKVVLKIKAAARKAGTTLDWAALFQKHDTRGASLLERTQFDKMMRESVGIPKDEVNDGELKALFNGIDADGTGHVSANELGIFMRHITHSAREAGVTVPGLEDADFEDEDEGSVSGAKAGSIVRLNKTFEHRIIAAKKRQAKRVDHGLLVIDQDVQLNGTRFGEGQNIKYKSPFASKNRNDKIEEFDETKEEVGEADPQLLSKMSHQMNRALSKYPDKAQRSWMRLFTNVDSDKSGLIDFGEFNVMVRRLLKLGKKTLSDKELRSVWLIANNAANDRDGKRVVGRLSASEFAAFMRMCEKSAKVSITGKIATHLMQALSKLSPDERTWYAVFALHDRNGTTMLSRPELGNLVRETLKLGVDVVSNQEIAALWSAIDVDSSGMISAGEFNAFISRCEALTSGAKGKKGSTHSRVSVMYLNREQLKLTKMKADLMRKGKAVEL